MHDDPTLAHSRLLDMVAAYPGGEDDPDLPPELVAAVRVSRSAERAARAAGPIHPEDVPAVLAILRAGAPPIDTHSWRAESATRVAQGFRAIYRCARCGAEGILDLGPDGGTLGADLPARGCIR